MNNTSSAPIFGIGRTRAGVQGREGYLVGESVDEERSLWAFPFQRICRTSRDRACDDCSMRYGCWSKGVECCVILLGTRCSRSFVRRDTSKLGVEDSDVGKLQLFKA